MKLNEIKNTIQLTKTEQGVLATIYVSPSPSSAFDNVTGTEQLILAQKKLISYGLIKVSTNQVKLTGTGKIELRRYNIVDKEGLTDYGKEVIQNSENDKKEWQSVD